ncbi:hypothetical protein bsdtb5_05840 [Anaeromicropila herbilytica]|uniref:Uncharacterized protein n=1 Tax=Anaeromicropila herbilytica TaxID=2785025 RepID=A0A7R7EID7_9FIRM|nr:hypothetical protein bsdtb5_05840 [Anaeromicropila herbilytica]
MLIEGDKSETIDIKSISTILGKDATCGFYHSFLRVAVSKVSLRYVKELLYEYFNNK